MRSPLVCAFALALAAAPTLAAQATVTGTVLDSRTEQPVAGAAVSVADAGARAVTDAEGRFTLRRVPEGEQRVLVRRVGYTELEAATAVADGIALDLRLDSDPVVLEAVEVTLDRLEQRRRAYPGRVWVVDQREIATSAARDLFDLVLYRAIPGGSPCGAGALCTQSRSARREAVRLVIDDHAIAGTAGIEALLRSYHPSEIHAVESYEGGAVVRVYTHWYIETVRGPLQPIRRI